MNTHKKLMALMLAVAGVAGCFSSQDDENNPTRSEVGNDPAGAVERDCSAAEGGGVDRGEKADDTQPGGHADEKKLKEDGGDKDALTDASRLPRFVWTRQPCQDEGARHPAYAFMDNFEFVFDTSADAEEARRFLVSDASAAKPEEREEVVYLDGSGEEKRFHLTWAGVDLFEKNMKWRESRSFFKVAPFVEERIASRGSEDVTEALLNDCHKLARKVSKDIGQSISGQEILAGIEVVTSRDAAGQVVETVLR